MRAPRRICTVSALRLTCAGRRRYCFAVKGARGRQLLAGWLSWATRSRIPEFVALAKTIKRFLPLIHNTFDHGVSNATDGVYASRSFNIG
jgi:transposase